MSETKFTPGPWEIDGFHMSSVIVLEGANWRHIADCDPEHFGGNRNWKADARLVCAAPQLFEALESLVEMDEANANRTSSHYRVTLDAARAALAKVADKRT